MKAFLSTSVTQLINYLTQLQSNSTSLRFHRCVNQEFDIFPDQVINFFTTFRFDLYFEIKPFIHLIINVGEIIIDLILFNLITRLH